MTIMSPRQGTSTEAEEEQSPATPTPRRNILTNVQAATCSVPSSPVPGSALNVEPLPSGPLSAQKQRQTEELLLVTCEVFLQLSSYKIGDKTICRFCQLENSHTKKSATPPTLDFDATSVPLHFWEHCRMEHRHFWRPDLPEIQNFRRIPANSTPFKTRLTPAQSTAVAEMVKEAVRSAPNGAIRMSGAAEIIFGRMVRVATHVRDKDQEKEEKKEKEKEKDQKCGLCELENSCSSESPFPSLTFDPRVNVDAFWQHWVLAHPEFWRQVESLS